MRWDFFLGLRDFTHLFLHRKLTRNVKQDLGTMFFVECLWCGFLDQDSEVKQLHLRTTHGATSVGTNSSQNCLHLRTLSCCKDVAGCAFQSLTSMPRLHCCLVGLGDVLVHAYSKSLNILYIWIYSLYFKHAAFNTLYYGYGSKLPHMKQWSNFPATLLAFPHPFLSIPRLCWEQFAPMPHLKSNMEMFNWCSEEIVIQHRLLTF